jgi:hypothetical protein
MSRSVLAVLLGALMWPHVSGINAYQADDLLVMTLRKSMLYSYQLRAEDDDGMGPDPRLGTPLIVPVRAITGKSELNVESRAGIVADAFIPFIRARNPYFRKKTPLGFLGLAADGKSVSFAVIQNEWQANRLSEINPTTARWSLARFLPDGSATYDTKVPYGGFWISSVATDNGTNFWFTNDDGLFASGHRQPGPA